MIAAAAMGDPNASIPTPQPEHYRPMFGAFGRALRTSVTFVSQAALADPALASLGLSRPLEAVRNTRKLGKRSEEHTSELQSLTNLVCRLLLEKKKNTKYLVEKSSSQLRTSADACRSTYI